LAEAGAFPRRHARTRGFTLGRPRGFAVGAGGARVAFLRSAGGDDPVNRLWVLDLDGGGERLVADPAALLGGSGELPTAELARRERTRERAGGIVAFGADRDLTVAAFALAGRLFVADLAAQTLRRNWKGAEADSKIDGEWQAAAPGGASAEPGRIGAVRVWGVTRLGSAMRPGWQVGG
jgi:dipeptidyl-peptidase-4